jgi:hypothetical protein
MPTTFGSCNCREQLRSRCEDPTMEKVPISALGIEVDVTDLVEVERIEAGRKGRVKTHPAFAREDDLATRGVDAPMVLLGRRQGQPATALRAILHLVPTDLGFWSSVPVGTELVVLDGDRPYGRAIVKWTAALPRGITPLSCSGHREEASLRCCDNGRSNDVGAILEHKNVHPNSRLPGSSHDRARAQCAKLPRAQERRQHLATRRDGAEPDCHHLLELLVADVFDAAGVLRRWGERIAAGGSASPPQPTRPRPVGSY